MAELRGRGVTFFLDLTEEGELEPYAGPEGEIPHRRMAVRDFTVPSESEMRAILDALDEALAAQHVVYLHCRGGLGRTGTVVGCWLVRHGADADEALRRIRTALDEAGRAGHASPETAAQVALVRFWRRGT